MNWQTLIEQKRKEIPKVQEEYEERIRRSVIEMEAILYEMCPKQVAGRKEFYTFDNICYEGILHFFYTLGLIPEPSDDVKKDCMERLFTKLKRQGVSCWLVDKKTAIGIVFP